MITSFLLLTALTVGADGEASTTIISAETQTASRPLDYYTDKSQEPPRVSVYPYRISGDESSVAAVDLISNREIGGPVQDSFFTSEDEGAYGTEDCGCCYETNSSGHFGVHQRFYPSPCFSPGNMTQHFPYGAEPKNYYYFRPYNWFHILEQQKEVVLYGGDPRHPYKNDLFQKVYLEIESQSHLVPFGN